MTDGTDQGEIHQGKVVYICSLSARTAMSGRDGAAVVNISSSAAYANLIFTDTIRAELARDEVSRVMGQQILPREGEEQDVVDALLFLVSQAASFVTGETLRVTGGFALSV
jgi:3-oxoacyl-[acyl-carrier protein] reductase